MFLTLDEVFLVEDKSKRKENDAVVYVKKDGRADNKTLWPDIGNQKEAYFGSKWNKFQRYGTLYEDTSGNWCVVPDVWTEEDAMMAKRSILLNEEEAI